MSWNLCIAVIRRWLDKEMHIKNLIHSNVETITLFRLKGYVTYGGAAMDPGSQNSPLFFSRKII